MKRILARLMGVNPRECEEVRATFTDYLDAELPAEQAARLEAHVGICPRYRKALGNLRLTLGALGRLGQPQPSDQETADRVLQAWQAKRD